jgi:hypothetical protein
MTDLTKPIKRRTVEPFWYTKKAIIVELMPSREGDIIRLRLVRQRPGTAVAIKVGDLYLELVKRKVAALKAERKKQRKKRK